VVQRLLMCERHACQQLRAENEELRTQLDAANAKIGRSKAGGAVVNEDGEAMEE
jgi:hypothetical protein